MATVGRKLYINFGDSVVAIERLSGVKPEDLGLTKEVSTKLVNIVNLMGERIELPIDGTLFPVNYGLDLNTYASNSAFWVTIEEYEKAQQLKTK
jgi:hypothetical protein